ncbi:MAG: hypothetical protein ABI451_09590 [Dokdonella sp.]
MIDRPQRETQSYQHPPTGVLLAQRAFAAFLDTGSHADLGDTAKVETSVRSTLSALSADDRNSLDRWLALQLIGHDGTETTRRLNALTHIDAWLSAAVRTQLPRVAQELMQAELMQPTRVRVAERIAA